ncbi:MAG: DUF1311 domain-containing protein [Filimonas sp.]|nr:DUF1311 domain-containing protein [Filimonas sp.]
MKPILLLLIACLSFRFCTAQEITPGVKQKLIAQIDKDAEAFKNSLAKQNKTKIEIAYAVDTFKIERLSDKEMDTDPSTAGANQAVSELTVSYDKLMNKYYNLLIAQLKGEDKKTLTAAQRAWITYRDAEKKLIGVVNSPAYTGGGTMYTTFTLGMYAKVISARAEQLFNYYNCLNP